MQEKLNQFAARVAAETLECYGKRFPGSRYDFTQDATATVHIGKKYARVDVGRSGKYMVDLATGEIFGIKGYGVIHRGHRFGTWDTIDDWHWGDYRAVKKGQVVNIKLTGKAV